MKRIGYFSLRLVVRFFSLLSFRGLYFLSDALFFLLFRVLRYRYQVVWQNLRASFPVKPDSELRRLAREYYRNLCDITLEAIKGLTLPEAELRRRYQFKNVELFDELYAQGQSFLVMGSHLGNWEWGVLSVSLWLKHKVVGIYKPLTNPYSDQYLRELRSQWGLVLSSMTQAGRALVRYRHEPCAFVFIADQTPSDTQNAHWIPFLNRDTPFLHGVDKIAHRSGYPVYQFVIRRRQRGFYEVTFSELCLNPSDYPEGGITRLYGQALERAIQEQPANWLWSHRRWKWSREGR